MEQDEGKSFCEIHTRQLNDMDGKLDSVLTGIATINQRCIDRGRAIDGHRKTLYGDNGTGGVVAKVNTLSSVAKTAKDINTTKKEWAMRILGPVISGLIVAAVLGLLVMWKLSGT